MLKSFRGRIIIILAAIGLSGGYLWTRGIKLGLDLQGGMHLVLEIDDPDGTLTAERRADGIERAELIIRNRVDEFGVEEPLIQRVGTDRLIVELAGLEDESRAKDIINRQAYLEWKLVLETTEVDQALERLDRAVVVAIGEEGLRAMGRATETGETTSIEQLLFSEPDDSAATADSAAAAGGDDTAAVAEPEEEELNLRPFTGLLNRGDVGTYNVDAADVETDHQSSSTLPEFQRALPRERELAVGMGFAPHRGAFLPGAVRAGRGPVPDGEQLDNATANRDQQSISRRCSSTSTAGAAAPSSSSPEPTSVTASRSFWTERW